MDRDAWAVYPESMPFDAGSIGLDSGTVLVAITLLVAPIAAVAFARSGPAWDSIGKGPLAIEAPPPESELPAPEAEAALRAEVRQLVVAGNARRARRGQPPLDVEAEIERMLCEIS